MSTTIDEKIDAIYRALPDAEMSPLFGYFKDIETLARIGQKDVQPIVRSMLAVKRALEHCVRDIDWLIAPWKET